MEELEEEEAPVLLRDLCDEDEEGRLDWWGEDVGGLTDGWAF